MVKYITFGNYNNLYKYLWYFIISRFIFSYFFTYKTVSSFFKFRILELDLFPDSIFAKDFFQYFFIFICSFIIYKVENWQKKDRPKDSQISDRSQILLIHFKYEKLFQIPNTFFIEIILLVLSDILINNYYHIGLGGLDFWELELLFFSLINSMIFKVQVYRHQKFAIYLIIISCSIIKVILIINIFRDDNIKKMYKAYIYLTPISIIGFILIIFLQSYTYCKAKFYFDLKYISVSTFLICVGLVGSIICLIASLISIKFKCMNYKKFYYISYICKSYENFYR